MNKVILSLLLAVCVLGMGLIMLNEPAERKPVQRGAQTTENSAPAASGTSLPSPPAPPVPSTPPIPPSPPAAAIAPVPTAPTVPPVPADTQQPTLAPPPVVVEQAAAAPEEKTVPAQPPIQPAPVQPAAKPADTPKPATTKSATKAKTVTRFIVVARDTGATVHITGSSPITYKTMNLQNPERIAIDMDGQWDIKAPGVPKNSLVTNVRLGKMPDKTRIVIDLKSKPKNARFVLSQNSDSLDIQLDQ